MRDHRDGLDNAAEAAPATDSQPPTAACQVPSAATPPHYVRRHTGIRVGPTRGHQAPTWAYLFELLVKEGCIAVAADQQLLPHDADRLADRMVLRTDTIREAFNSLVQHKLLVFRMSAGRYFASPDLRALQELLREQQRLELAGAQGPAIAALTYFRSRHAWVGLAWMAHALGEESECEGIDTTQEVGDA